MSDFNSPWKRVKTARKHGFNVRRFAHGWAWGVLTARGYVYKPWAFPNRSRALLGAWLAFTGPA